MNRRIEKISLDGLCQRDEKPKNYQKRKIVIAPEATGIGPSLGSSLHSPFFYFFPTDLLVLPSSFVVVSGNVFVLLAISHLFLSCTAIFYFGGISDSPRRFIK